MLISWQDVKVAVLLPVLVGRATDQRFASQRGNGVLARQALEVAEVQSDDRVHAGAARLLLEQRYLHAGGQGVALEPGMWTARTSLWEVIHKGM